MLFAAVGLHPLVDMLLKEIYHLRASLPHSLLTWDVVKVTTYHLLNVKTVSLKNVTLCALSSALREQTVCLRS